LAAWTNLSETTFLLPPTSPEADYRVRIFTPVQELPFAGHPTLGTAHVWLEHVAKTSGRDVVVQECGAGLVRVRRDGGRLAFAAPPLLRSGPVEDSIAGEIYAALELPSQAVVDARWLVNGPQWIGVLLQDADALMGVQPRFVERDVGLVAPLPADSDAAFEVRAFFPKDGALIEDPVTGSLNAALAQWLLETGRAQPPYVVRQGTALGRAGRVHVTLDAAGTIWIGGSTTTVLRGFVDI
jgi:PhzF family phenazine biosynthesis protein